MTRIVVAFVVFFLSFDTAIAQSVNLDYRLQPVYSDVNENSLFLAPSPNQFSARQDVIVDAYWNNFSIEWTAFQRLGDHQDPIYRGVLNEAYWDSTIKNWEISIGKKKSLGV